MKAAVIDDSIEYHKQIQRLLKDYPDILCDFYSTGIDFLNTLSENKYDAVLLDIEMPDIDGLKLSKEIYQRDDDCLLAFITNHPETVFQAFGMNVISFIQKDALSDEFPLLIKKIKTELSGRKAVLLQLKSHQTVKVRIDEVIYAEIVLRSIHLHTEHGQYILQETSISRAYEQFSESGFAFVNRSCFVNIRKIRAIDSEKLYLSGIKNPVYISRYQYKNVKQAYMESI